MSKTAEQTTVDTVENISTQKQWTPDLPAEQLLTKLDVSWVYSTVGIGLIDQQASLQNQARLGVSIHQETMDEYATAMRDGAAFPALVGFMRPNGSFILAGGNHRLAAAKSTNRLTVDLYVCDVKDEAIRRLITTSLNTTVGVRTTREDAVIQAVSWMESYGRSVSAAAQAYNLPRESLDTYLRYRDTRRRLQGVGLIPDKINRSSLKHLSRITNDNVLRDAALFQLEFGVTEQEFRDLLSNVNATRTESDQIAVIQEWRKRDDIKARRSRQTKKVYRSPYQKNRTELARVLSTAQNLLKKHNTRGRLGLTNDDDWQASVTAAEFIASTLRSMAPDSAVSTQPVTAAF